MSMLRFNTGKAQLHLVPTAFITAIASGLEAFELPTLLLDDVARVLEFGAKKYEPHNWRRGGSWCQVWNSGMRHVHWMLRGQSHDEESGLHHMAHLGCNIAFLCEFVAYDLGTDDRYKTQPILEINEIDDGIGAVFSDLHSWKDGGPTEDLVMAARGLAAWYETLAEPERALRPGTSEHAFIRTARQ